MKTQIKTLTLSIEEIATLIEITDTDARRQVMQSLIEGSQNPTETIVESNFADSHPMALQIARKISRKARAAHRRRLKRDQKKQQTELQKTQQPVDTEAPASNEPLPEIPRCNENEKVILTLNDEIVRQLQWLKRYFKPMRRNIQSVIDAITGNPITRQIFEHLAPLYDRLFSYIANLAGQVENYFMTARRQRPLHAIS